MGVETARGGETRQAGIEHSDPQHSLSESLLAMAELALLGSWP